MPTVEAANSAIGTFSLILFIGSSIYLVYSLNKFVNGRIFSDYFDFLRYNQPSNWEEILFDQSIYFKIDYWFNI